MSKPRRQEQEDASEEVTEVAPNVLRMQLPISMPGLGHVNCYALVDDEGAAVMDPGLPGSASWKALTDRLRKADLTVKNIHTVLVTHSHPDHFGGASRIASESGAKIIGHKSFRFGVASDPAADGHEVSAEDLVPDPDEGEEPGDLAPPELPPAAKPGSGDRWGSRVTPWGGKGPRPPWRMRLKWMAMRSFQRVSFVPEVTHPVSHGDVLRLAGREWKVVHTPGHTEDHFCLHDREEGVFLAGDHVLPTITPHISGISLHKDPLNEFFRSLDRVAAIPDVKLALPAHGHPFDDLAGRCYGIKEHHAGRLARLAEIAVELGPASVQAFSQKLFKERSWGAMAESETYAHLEHMRLLGDAERHENAAGLFIYEAG